VVREFGSWIFGTDLLGSNDNGRVVTLVLESLEVLDGSGSSEGVARGALPLADASDFGDLPEVSLVRGIGKSAPEIFESHAEFYIAALGGFEADFFDGCKGCAAVEDFELEPGVGSDVRMVSGEFKQGAGLEFEVSLDGPAAQAVGGHPIARGNLGLAVEEFAQVVDAGGTVGIDWVELSGETGEGLGLVAASKPVGGMVTCDGELAGVRHGGEAGKGFDKEFGISPEGSTGEVVGGLWGIFAANLG
jgi:hypothetical protein